MRNPLQCVRARPCTFEEHVLTWQPPRCVLSSPLACFLNGPTGSFLPTGLLKPSKPTLCGFAYDSSTILEAFHNPAALAYDPQPKGLLSAREEVARYYRDDPQAAVDPESLILTTSTSEAYSYVFRLLCNPQDEILVPKPSYPLFGFLA